MFTNGVIRCSSGFLIFFFPPEFNEPNVCFIRPPGSGAAKGYENTLYDFTGDKLLLGIKRA